MARQPKRGHKGRRSRKSTNRKIHSRKAISRKLVRRNAKGSGKEKSDAEHFRSSLERMPEPQSSNDAIAVATSQLKLQPSEEKKRQVEEEKVDRKRSREEEEKRDRKKKTSGERGRQKDKKRRKASPVPWSESSRGTCVETSDGYFYDHDDDAAQRHVLEEQRKGEDKTIVMSLAEYLPFVKKLEGSKSKEEGSPNQERKTNQQDQTGKKEESKEIPSKEMNKEMECLNRKGSQTKYSSSKDSQEEKSKRSTSKDSQEGRPTRSSSKDSNERKSESSSKEKTESSNKQKMTKSENKKKFKKSQSTQKKRG